jgi:hypothetical protein
MMTEDNRCDVIDASPVDGFRCDVVPTVAAYLVRDDGLYPSVLVLWTRSRVRKSELPEPSV